MTATIRDATEADVLALHDKLRPEDQAEVQAACGFSPMKSLLHGLHHGKCWAWDVDGEPAAMYGVIRSSLDPKIGYIWLLGTPAIEQNSVAFLRQSRDGLAQASEGYEVLTTWSDCRNAVHLKWLSWLGFDLGRVEDKFGFEQRPFVQASYYPTVKTNV